MMLCYGVSYLGIIGCLCLAIKDLFSSMKEAQSMCKETEQRVKLVKALDDMVAAMQNNTCKVTEFNTKEGELAKKSEASELIVTSWKGGKRNVEFRLMGAGGAMRRYRHSIVRTTAATVQNMSN